MANVTAITKWANASPDNFARWVVRNRGTLENNGIRIWADLAFADPAKMREALARAEREVAEATRPTPTPPAEAANAWAKAIEAVNARVGARQ